MQTVTYEKTGDVLYLMWSARHLEVKRGTASSTGDQGGTVRLSRRWRALAPLSKSFGTGFTPHGFHWPKGVFLLGRTTEVQ